MNKVIEAKDLTMTLGDRKIIDHLSLAVNKGKVFGLLGPNGAEKTTTIETILDIKQSDHGSTHILGQYSRKSRRKLFEKVGANFNPPVIKQISK
ncbi:ATP-binding cassette domain-containing protein [Enterococcus durans]|uniref:ATP-binding cassette domain-containing protein n=1 Tax=Enterococcus durans TaxID=53345 RepID=UPI0028907199|nr:ATP-binding cassette domain-containing protein [Enterococcus durans]MDT2837667.1 ATP-binding cassette domain-containing protein [Enterococcus durans]